MLQPDASRACYPLRQDKVIAPGNMNAKRYRHRDMQASHSFAVDCEACSLRPDPASKLKVQRDFHVVEKEMWIRVVGWQESHS